MSYLRKKDKPLLDEALAKVTVAGPGELQYSITTLVLKHLAQHRSLDRYALNTVMGVLEHVQLELYRKISVPFENGEQLLSGDMFAELARRFNLRSI